MVERKDEEFERDDKGFIHGTSLAPVVTLQRQVDFRDTFIKQRTYWLCCVRLPVDLHAHFRFPFHDHF
jgi:hypothetical protein